MAVAESYFSLTEKYNLLYGDKTILLMHVGSFFEVYGLKDDDGVISGSLIMEFSKILDFKVSEKKQKVRGKTVLMSGFKDYTLDQKVNKLQYNGYTCVIYVQDTPEQNTTRSLSHIVGPGTHFNDEETTYSNNIACIWFHVCYNKYIGNKIIIGVANIDIFTGEVTISEYNKMYYHNPTTYDELERFISIYKPVESMLIYDMDDEIMNEIIQFINLNSKKIHRINLNEKTEHNKIVEQCEKQLYREATIQNYYSDLNDTLLINELEDSVIAFQSLCYILDFINKHNPNLVKKINTPLLEKNTNRLILANHSLKQLNIIDDDVHKGKYSSVNKLLNMCVTPMGIRKFNYILLNPITNIETLNESYDITDYALDLNNLESWKQHLNSIKDMDKLIRKIMLGKITPCNFYNIYKTIESAEKLYTIICDDGTLCNYIQCPELMKKIKENKKKLEYFLNMDNCFEVDTLSFEKCTDENDELIYFVNRNVNHELDMALKISLECKDKLEAIKNKLDKCLSQKEKNRKTSDGYIKYHETGNSGINLKLTGRRAGLLKGVLENLENDTCELSYISKYSNREETFTFDIKNCTFQSQNDSACFIKSGTLNGLYMQIVKSKHQYISTLKTVYFNFVKQCIQMQNGLSDISLFITNMDVLYCKYLIAKTLHYSKPIIEKKDKSFLDIKDIRHCLIEKLQQKELYVTNDIDLGLNMDGICLFGTNAVGKTCLIKAMGICVVLAQCGLYVPCKQMNYFPYDYIFTRILGNDNIFKGLSTFEVEMSEFGVILKHATPNSLILGDELCSGTEIDSALGLFISGLDYLHNIGCSFIFATHYHKIVRKESIQRLNKLCMKHMTVQYNREFNKLIYDRKLKEGSGDSIYGLEVCKSLNLPEAFLKKAYDERNNDIGKASVLEQSVSRYNSSKLRGKCEICKLEMGTEIHHLQYQKDGKNGYIEQFDVNHKANLMTICEECHKTIHKNNLKMIRTKTSNGYEFIEK